MSTAENLQALLAPLGVYDWGESFQKTELNAVGAATDAAMAELEETAQEMNLTTAQSWGLEWICRLLESRPTAENPEQLRAALMALLRIRDSNLTLQAMQDNIVGCGLAVEIQETATLEQVKVIFPGVVGLPSNFERLRPMIEKILPCHLEILYPTENAP